MNYEIGDRVRVTAQYRGILEVEVTGFHEETILEGGHEGQIVAFAATGIPVVQWDSGDYRIFSDYAPSQAGLAYLDKGSAQLQTFVSTIHPDHITPIDLSCVANRPNSTATEKRAAQLRIHDESTTREVEALLANIGKQAREKLPKEALRFGEVSKETVQNVPSNSYFCLSCSGWVLPKFAQESRAVGAIALHTGGLFTPVKVLTQSTDIAICSRCGAQVSLNADEYAKKLEFEKEHPVLARIKHLFR